MRLGRTFMGLLTMLASCTGDVPATEGAPEDGDPPPFTETTGGDADAGGSDAGEAEDGEAAVSPACEADDDCRLGEACQGGQCAVTEEALVYDGFDPHPNPLSFGTFGRWNRTNLTWRVANPPAGLTQMEAEGAASAAFAGWQSQSSLTFTQAPAGAPADITLSAVMPDGAGNHGDQCAFGGNVLAHAFFPNPGQPVCPLGEIHFNDRRRWTWSASPGVGQLDYEAVVLHEVGHALGLTHSDVPGAVMLPNYSGQRTLGADDIAGIRALYPPDETCDGADEDGDGAVDEGVTNACGGCGDVPAEVCNGEDDDCDGRADEGLECGGCEPTPEVCFNGARDEDCDGLVDEGCGVFVASSPVCVGRNAGLTTVEIDFPAGAAEAIGLLAVNTAIEHGDNRCDFDTTVSRAGPSRMRFDIRVDRCDHGHNDNPCAFAADALVVARMPGPGRVASFALQTFNEAAHDVAFAANGGGDITALATLVGFHGGGDVDFEGSATAEIAGGRLRGTAREQHGNRDSYVRAIIAGIAWPSNVVASRQSFRCETGGSVRVTHPLDGNAAPDHAAFVFVDNVDTDTKDHISWESDCRLVGDRQQCDILCYGSADAVAGSVLFLDGTFAAR